MVRRAKHSLPHRFPGACAIVRDIAPGANVSGDLPRQNPKRLNGFPGASLV